MINQQEVATVNSIKNDHQENFDFKSIEIAAIGDVFSGAIGGISSITAMDLAKWFAQGAVQFAGGLALSAILGSPSSEQIAELVRKSVEEIKFFIKEELRRQLQEYDLLGIKSSISATLMNLKDSEYMKNPEIALNISFSNTADAIFQSEKYGLSGIILFVDAVSLRIMTITAMNKNGLVVDAKKMIEQQINFAKSHIDQLSKRNIEAHKNRIAGISEVLMRLLGDEDCTVRMGPDRLCKIVKRPYYYIKIDGEERYGSKNEQDIINERNDIIKKIDLQLQEAEEKLHKPLADIIQVWMKTMSDQEK